MIPESVIEEVRARLDAAEVIGRHVPLRKSGSSLLGACPFHAEKSPSFRVYPDQKRFYCYGCGAHGDVFEFIGKLLGKEFPEVIRELAEEVGVQVSDEGGPPHLEMFRKQRAGALAACEASAVHWASRLWGPEGEMARRYLGARGVTEATAHQFKLGVASAGWHDLETAIAGRNGLTLADLVRAGVVVRKAKRRFDRFRGRLVFPCTDSTGRVIGFVGRALEAARDHDGREHLSIPGERPDAETDVVLGPATEAVVKARAGPVELHLGEGGEPLGEGRRQGRVVDHRK